MKRLRKIHESLVSKVDTKFQRYLVKKINWTNRLISISGARGSGKTTLLLQYIQLNHGLDKQALYVTLDDIYFEETRLLHFVEAFVENGGTHLYLDEVHKYKFWSKDLKLIYDYHPNLQVVFTGSSALNIYKGDSDLSRRAVTYELYGLSFREFIQFELGLELPIVSVEDIINTDVFKDLKDQIDISQLFNDFLKIGYYPFYLEGKQEYDHRLINVVNLVLETDLPSIEAINFQSIHKLKRLLAILSNIVPFTPNITKLAQQVGVSRDILLKYLSWLERANIIQMLHGATKSMGPLTRPDKIFLNNTNLCYALGESAPNRGSLRETFFINQLSVNHQVHTPKYGDFTIDNRWVFEVGGPSKTPSQLRGTPQSYVAADDIFYKRGKVIPLWHFGFLY